MMRYSQLAVLLGLLISLVCAINNGLGKTPQMGWNSWNHFGCDISENLIKQTADLLVSSGFAKLGYVYLNLDDCWQIARDENGKILQDKIKFPSGMKALADYVHSQGLKFGLYSDAGTQTCQGRPGSLGYEQIDAQTYAEWGVDYLKYDNCHNLNIDPQVRYPPMSQALNETGRPIFFSLCQWGNKNPWKWAGQLGNSWRTTGDISDNWDSFLQILYKQVGLETYAGPGGWNDPDMLEVGNGGMTLKEYQCHFALWALLKAPLLLGCDLNDVKPSGALELLKNEEIIAVNQDPLGVQGKRIFKKNIFLGREQIWAGPLADGSIAVVLFNPGLVQTKISLTFSQIGLQSNTAKVRDLINQKDLGQWQSGFQTKVAEHGCVMLRIWPQ